jgi:hypothetical protein
VKVVGTPGRLVVTRETIVDAGRVMVVPDSVNVLPGAVIVVI